MILDNGTKFIWENARLLERAMFEYHFCGGAGARILTILGGYQNVDGGFGHALEPDLRAPDSHPLFVEFGLRTLYSCQLRDAEIASRICEFLARHADLEHGIPALFSSSRNYPRAAHWNNQTAELPSWDRFIGLVGLINWQGIHHPWLQQAVDTCVDRLASTTLTDAHTILTAFCLLESLPHGMASEGLFEKLASALRHADFFAPDVPVTGYSLTPLDFAPTPASYCRVLFSDTQLEAHLNELASTQEADGGWSISWEPPGRMAAWEWRACKTVSALVTLRAYGKI